MVDALSRMEYPQHRIVSLLGNMMADGQATPYNAVIRMADQFGALHYPSPLPVLVRDAAELVVLHAQEPVRNIMALCAKADLVLVGIGRIGPRAPILLDGFVTASQSERLLASGAVGEISS